MLLLVTTWRWPPPLQPGGGNIDPVTPCSGVWPRNTLQLVVEVTRNYPEKVCKHPKTGDPRISLKKLRERDLGAKHYIRPAMALNWTE